MLAKVPGATWELAELADLELAGPAAVNNQNPLLITLPPAVLEAAVRCCGGGA